MCIHTTHAYKTNCRDNTMYDSCGHRVGALPLFQCPSRKADPREGVWI